jgi:energy-coupling factor transport system permease protein
MIEECYGIINAMRARGLDLKGGIRTKLRAAKYLFLPLIVNILRSGRQIAIAADARGFRATKNRSYVKELKLNSNDYVFLTMVIIFTGFGIYLSLVGYGSTPPI